MSNIEETLIIKSEAEDGSLKGRVWMESKKIWRIAFPAILARMALFGVILVTQAFVGHMGALELSAFAVVQTILVRFVSGVTLGMSSATETLCGQAFGAGQYHMMGIYLQRSWIVSTSAATIFVPVFIFATQIFKLLGEEDDIATEAGIISLWFIPVLYSTVFSSTMQMFLQAQLKNFVIIWLTVATFAIHVLLSWILVYLLNYGIPGAMVAMNISFWLLVFGEFVYILRGWCPDAWRGFSKAAFSNILPVIKLSISSGVMICLELWYNSVLVLLAGYMKSAETAIATFSICLNIATWELMIGLGFLVAASVRISNELGRGNTKAAKFSIKVILSTGTFIGVIFSVVCLFWSHPIAYVFTSSEEVAKSVSSLSIPLAFSVLLNSIQPILSGVAIGAGLQSVVAYVNIGCYYMVGVPIGALLGYVAHLEVKGIWIGMICGVAIQALSLLFMTWRTDWEKQVTSASERLNRWLLNAPDQESNQSLIQNSE
ncbi:protein DETOXIFICATION 20-like [Pistacia vera]|uniref:protein DETOXIFICATION 20-like n=1 Tax=Pistacia vera TaxID=55513 RepID=UPI001262E6F1|nr:protein DETOXIFICATION 20-like [Pistacia vera]